MSEKIKIGAVPGIRCSQFAKRVQEASQEKNSGRPLAKIRSIPVKSGHGWSVTSLGGSRYSPQRGQKRTFPDTLPAVGYDSDRVIGIRTSMGMVCVNGDIVPEKYPKVPKSAQIVPPRQRRREWRRVRGSKSAQKCPNRLTSPT